MHKVLALGLTLSFISSLSLPAHALEAEQVLFMSSILRHNPSALDKAKESTSQHPPAIKGFLGLYNQNHSAFQSAFSQLTTKDKQDPILSYYYYAAALMKKDQPALLFLLNQKLPVHYSDPQNPSLLFVSLYQNPASLTEFLALGADPNASYQGNTPLHLAVQLNQTKAVTALLKAGANRHATDPQGQKAIAYAQTSEIKQQLQKDRLSPLENALKSQDTMQLETLLKQGLNPNQSFRKQWTPLMYCSENGNYNCTELLLDHGAQIDALNQFNTTALFLAAEQGHGQIVTLLLKHGAQANLKDKTGRNPLYYAASQANTTILKQLLEAGASLNSKQYQDGWTPLIKACSAGQTENVRFLLKAGADPQLLTKSKSDALMIAAAKGHREIVSLLLKAGANPRNTSRKGKTALDFARLAGHQEIVKLLQSALE